MTRAQAGTPREQGPANFPSEAHRITGYCQETTMMDIGDRIYRAERSLNVAEQRAVDAANGELIASLARLWHRTAARLHDRHGSGPTATVTPETLTSSPAASVHPRAGYCPQVTAGN